MRHLLRRFACLVLSLAMLSSVAPALAAQGPNADFFLTQLIAQEKGYGNLEYPQSAVAVADALYIQTDRALYRWQSGMAEPESLLAFPRSDGDEEEAPQTPDPSAAVDPLGELMNHFRNDSYWSKLLTDGERLLVLGAREGILWQLLDAAGEVNPALQAKLDFAAFQNMEGGYSYPDIKDIALTDGWLYMVAVDYEKSQNPVLHRWELATGKAGTPLPCQITSLEPYKDGRLLCFLLNEEEWSTTGKEPATRLAVLDPKTNAFEELLSPGGYGCVGLAYNSETNTAYYMEGTTAYSLPGLALPAKKSAYMLNRTWYNIGSGLMRGGLYYQAGSEGVSIRALDQPGMENGALSVYGVYYSPAHMAFASQHPDIPTALFEEYFGTLEAFAGAMVSGQDAVDVLRLYANGTPMNQLIDKGYAMDLSGNAQVMAAAGAMYPAMVEPYRRDGKLYALPVDMQASSLGYYQDALRELGLTQEDLPATWIELLDFIGNWQEDYGEDNPGIHITDNQQVKDPLLYALMESYVAYSMKTWGKIDFDAPLFAKLMEAYDAIDFSQLDLPADDGEDQNTFWEEKHLFSFYADYTQMQYQELDRAAEFWMSTPLPVPLDEGLEVVIPATQSVMIINPRTTRPEQAQLYLSVTSQYYEKTTVNITLFPEHNEPVPNLSFEEEQADWKKSLAQVKKALETAAPEERANLEDQAKRLQDWIDNADSYRYSVRAEAIAYYRESIAPYLYPVGQTPLNTWREGQENQLYVLMQQYKEGALPLERFISEIGKRVRMMELENQ